VPQKTVSQNIFVISSIKLRRFYKSWCATNLPQSNVNVSISPEQCLYTTLQNLKVVLWKFQCWQTILLSNLSNPLRFHPGSWNCFNKRLEENFFDSRSDLINVYLRQRTPFSFRNLNDDIRAVTVNEVMRLPWRCALRKAISSVSSHCYIHKCSRQ